MPVATPPVGASSGEHVRSSLELIAARDRPPMRRLWTDATFDVNTRLLSRLRGRRRR